MINDSQHMARTSADERVIQRRANIDQHQGTAKNRATDNLPGRSTYSDHQHERSCESQCRPDAVGYGVRDDVAQLGFRDHREGAFTRGDSRLDDDPAPDLFVHRGMAE